MVCRRCYLWGIANRRQVKRKRGVGVVETLAAARDGFRVGKKVRIEGLANAIFLNGKTATIVTAEDDDGRLLVNVADHPNLLRLQRDRLMLLANEGQSSQNGEGADIPDLGAGSCMRPAAAKRCDLV